MPRDVESPELKTFYICGCESAFAWVETRTGKTHKQAVRNLSAKAATVAALSSVVSYLPNGSEAFVFTHSVFLHRDFNRFRSCDEIIFPTVAEMTRQMIKVRKLTIHVERIGRNRNPAWKLLSGS